MPARTSVAVGYDPLEEVKRAAAERWVAAVNADGTYGQLRYALVKKVTDTEAALASAVGSVGASVTPLSPTRSSSIETAGRGVVNSRTLLLDKTVADARLASGAFRH